MAFTKDLCLARIEVGEKYDNLSSQLREHVWQISEFFPLVHPNGLKEYGLLR